MSPYVLAAWLTFSSVGLASPSAAQTTLVLDRVTVVDVLGGSLFPDMRIVIRADTIRAVGRFDEIGIPSGARVVDGEGLYALPGLWDMHVHLHAWEETGPALLVANGVTGVREMGGVFVDLDRLRRRIASDEILGPRMVIAGEMLDGPTPGDWPFRITVTTPEEGRIAVRDQLERGVDFIKTKEFLDEETFLAIAEAAREAGLHLTGHVPQGMSAVEVSRLGQRSVEHLAGTPSCAAPEASSPASAETDRCPNPAFDAAVQVFLAEETWHTPTLTVARAFIDLADSLPSTGPRVRFRTEAVEAFWNWELSMIPELPPATARSAWLDGALRQVRELHRAGIPLLAGTDLSIPEVYPGFSLHDELALLVRAGLEPVDALRAATIEPARYLELQASMGSVAPGKVADLVLLDADPLSDIDHTRRIQAVVLRGTLLDRDALDRLLDDALAR